MRLLLWREHTAPEFLLPPGQPGPEREVHEFNSELLDVRERGPAQVAHQMRRRSRRSASDAATALFEECEAVLLPCWIPARMPLAIQPSVESFNRTAAGRMSERELVPVIGTRTAHCGSMVPGLQPRAAAQLTGISDAKEILEGVSFALLSVNNAEPFGRQGNFSGSLSRGLDCLRALPKRVWEEGEGNQ
jgi:hypothetical protein